MRTSRRHILPDHQRPHGPLHQALPADESRPTASAQPQESALCALGRSSLRKFAPSSASTSIHPSTPSCCPWTRRARSRRSTAPSRRPRPSCRAASSPRPAGASPRQCSVGAARGRLWQPDQHHQVQSITPRPSPDGHVETGNDSWRFKNRARSPTEGAPRARVARRLTLGSQLGTRSGPSNRPTRVASGGIRRNSSFRTPRRDKD
jgi:hypothetical protein